MMTESARPVVILDECVHAGVVAKLTAAGWRVAHAGTAAPSASDADILAWAVAERAILVTADRDFGGLIFGSRAAPPLAAILLRLVPAGPLELSEMILTLLNDHETIGHFTVIDTRGMRRRPLP